MYVNKSSEPSKEQLYLKRLEEELMGYNGHGNLFFPPLLGSDSFASLGLAQCCVSE